MTDNSDEWKKGGLYLPPGTPLPPGTRLPPDFKLPPGTPLPPGATLPPDFKLPPGTPLPKGTALPPGRFCFRPKYETDKFESGLMAEYITLLQGLRARPVRILEVGMGQGGSMEFFLAYFTHSESRFVGLDLVPPNVEFDARATVIQCDQNDSEKLQAICKENGPFDVIVDDGSHFARETWNTFKHCHAHVVPGGYYIIEDWMAHYMGERYRGMVGVVAHILEGAVSYGFDELKILKVVPGSTAIFRKKLG